MCSFGNTKKNKKRGESRQVIRGMRTIDPRYHPSGESRLTAKPALCGSLFHLFFFTHKTMPHVGHQRIFSYVFFLTALVGVAFFVAPKTFAATTAKKVTTPAVVVPVTRTRAPELRIGSSAARIPILVPKFKGGATVAVADVNGDGVDEYVIGAGPNGGPIVEVYTADGTMLSQFYAFDKKIKSGVTVAAGQIDGNGSTQIVVATQAGGNAEVRVFNVSGTLLRKFNAFESGYTGGMNIGIISGRNGSGGYIIVGSGFGREDEVRVYTASGSKVVQSISPFGKLSGNGVTVAGGWSDTFAQNVVIVGASQGDQPVVQVWGMTSKTKLAQWLAYDAKVKTGINVAFRNDRVITGPSLGGGPDARMFDMHGTLQSSTVMFENLFRGGIRVAGTVIAGVLIPVAVPTSQPGVGSGAKKIVVSLSKQTLTMYENGQIVSIRRVSTGKWSTPTPPGIYKTYNKIPNAYSKAYGLYMEWWMAFQPDGSMGLHALPYWKLKDGGKLYEGAAHIGTPVSHGCIRQTLTDAKSLYDWAPIGTPVVIEK